MNSTKLVRGVKSIVLTSESPQALAAFYRDTLEVPLEEERRRGTSTHWACQLGELHFAVHDRAEFWLPSGASTLVSFTIDAVAPFEERLARQRVELRGRRRIGPMDFLAFQDPDGRFVGCGTPWPGA
jgi:hypothetical protein